MGLTLVKSFSAIGDKTVKIVPTTTSQALQLSISEVGLGTLKVTRGAIRIYNATGQTVFILFGPDNTVTATTACMPIPAGEVEVIGLGHLVKYVGVIIASGTETANIYFTHGEGI
jgi:hypothetical protein